MKTLLLIAYLTAAAISSTSLRAEQHRATRLGNPATRFAPPLVTIQDLRSRFRDERLRPDFAEVLRQWGWPGKVEDLHRAAATSEVQQIAISVGTVMPFMSSRENGRPICLRNVLWAGQEPAPAFAFYFNSNGRRYRCVTPKACSNFFIEDLGPLPVPALSLVCSAPEQVLPGRTFQICATLRNPGTGPVPAGTLRLTLPPETRLIATPEGASIGGQEIAWNFTNLASKAEARFCATLVSSTPGTLPFQVSATGLNIKDPVSSHCSTKVIGIPAILIDAVDLQDPVEVGTQVTYEVKVTNQGTSEATNVKLLFILPPNEEFISGDGASPVRSAQTIATDPLPLLAPKDAATWRVIVKANQPGDIRFKIELTSDQFSKPIHEEESTRLY